MPKFVQLIFVIIGKTILKSFDFLVDVFVTPQAVFTPQAIKINSILLENLDLINLDYKSIYEADRLNNIEDFYKVDTEIGQDENWKAFPLKLYNYRFEDNIEQCPNIYQVLEKIPSCTSAMISVLYPNKHITPHRGLYKGIIRCLFSIEAPANGGAWIMIDGTKYIFRNGEAIYFDETYLHEVKNESLEKRVALYLDIYRQLPFPLNILNRIVFHLLKFSPFISEKVKGYQKITHTKVVNQKGLTAHQF